MEDKINIAEILRDMPEGTKLYSPILGEVELEVIKTIEYGCEYPIIVTTTEPEGGSICFADNGLYYNEYAGAEPTLFPSRYMRDWTKFFKRGDVVTNKSFGTMAVFESWADVDYTKFNVTIKCYSDSTFGINRVCITNAYSKATDEQKAEFIAKAEEYYNGKYNPETLRVESIEPECEFKPFDRVLVRDNDEQE